MRACNRHRLRSGLIRGKMRQHGSHERNKEQLSPTCQHSRMFHEVLQYVGAHERVPTDQPLLVPLQSTLDLALPVYGQSGAKRRLIRQQS